MKAASVVVLTSAVALAGCGGGGTGPDGNGGGAGMSARIEGVNWEASQAAVVNIFAGQYEISGLTQAHSVSLQLAHVSGPGTFPLGVSSSIVGGQGVVTQSIAVGIDTIWTTNWPEFGGEVVITTLTSSRVAGTFHFDAARSVVASTRSVTQGSFDLAITGGAGPGAGDTGHLIQGDVQGPFVATYAELSWPAGTSPTLGVMGSAIMTTLRLDLDNVPGPGTYALDTLPPLRSITVIGRPGFPAGQWTTARAGGSGSVTVTSVTPQRIRGTFSATVMANVGGATGTFPVSGTFDMGRGGP